MSLSLASAAWIASTAPLAVTANAAEAPLIEQNMALFQQSEPDAAPEPLPQSDTRQEEGAAETGDAPDGNVIVVTGDNEERKKDPLVNVNETAFEVTQAVDQAVVEPIAEVYEEDLPSPIRKGLRNFFRNLLEPVTALNYFLQLKPGKAFETLGRFTVNTTVGVAGLFDVAKKEPFNLPYRRNGFANTLGYYGVGPGPFLVLPLVGATTLRDVLGGGVDQAFLPLAVGKPFGTPLYAIPAYTVNSLEFRIEFDERLEAINTSDDPYYAMRETYLCNREAEIAALKNRPPPRDCSIEAIMGLDADTVAQLTSAAETAPETGGEPITETAPASPPEIQYVSKPVVQALPADYSPAPPPSS